MILLWQVKYFSYSHKPHRTGQYVEKIRTERSLTVHQLLYYYLDVGLDIDLLRLDIDRFTERLLNLSDMDFIICVVMVIIGIPVYTV